MAAEFLPPAVDWVEEIGEGEPVLVQISVEESFDPEDVVPWMHEKSSKTNELPPCTECGACCVGFDGVHVAHGDDITPSLTYPKTSSGVDVRRYETYMRMFPEPRTKKQTRCCALNGVVGKEVACDIYEERPRACKEFLRGSKWCRFMRIYVGLDPVEEAEKWMIRQMNHLREQK